MKICSKVLKLLVSKKIIPEILERNPFVQLAYNPVVTRRGVYISAVMRKCDICTIMWELPNNCNVLVQPHNADIIFWHGIEIIRVEE